MRCRLHFHSTITWPISISSSTFFFLLLYVSRAPNSLLISLHLHARSILKASSSWQARHGWETVPQQGEGGRAESSLRINLLLLMARRMRNMFSHYFNFFISLFFLSFSESEERAEVGAEDCVWASFFCIKKERISLFRHTKRKFLMGRRRDDARQTTERSSKEGASKEWKSHKINLLLKITRHFRELSTEDVATKSLRVQALMPQWGWQDERRREKKEISFTIYSVLLHDKDDDIQPSWVSAMFGWIRQSWILVRIHFGWEKNCFFAALQRHRRVFSSLHGIRLTRCSAQTVENG